MAKALKSEFPPLLPPGIHLMTIDELKKTCVDNFPNSKRRPDIYLNFINFLRFVSCINIIDEIWVDGSFLTEKEEPDDIDAVAFAYHADTVNITAAQKSVMDQVFSNPVITKIRFMTDIRFCIKENDNMRSFWRGWYCFSRDEVPKGAVAIKIRGITI